MYLLIKKYEPKKLSDIIGQTKALAALQGFVVNFSKQKKKAVLIYGPSGTGKTSSVHALANSLALEIIEVNASELRNKEQVNDKVGAALKQKSLFSKGKIILFDEIDGLNTSDRGGLTELLTLIEDSHYPIFLTITNPWDFKYNKLRQKAFLIPFDAVSSEEIFKLLKKICDNEKIKYDEDALLTLARKSGGDVRGAIIDLEILSQSAKKIDKENVDMLSDREKDVSIQNALKLIFKTKQLNLAIKIFEYADEKQDEQFLWIDENLPLEYKKIKDLARAYEALSMADVFRRRIMRSQYWRLMVYINAYLTAGIALAKDEKYKDMNVYKPTGRLLKIWWANQKAGKKKDVAEKLAKHTHTSKKEAIKNILYFRTLFKKDNKFAEAVAKELDLNEEEVEWLKK